MIAWVGMSKKSLSSFMALLALLLVLAGIRPLALPDEGRYGEIGLWMLQSGDWLVPRINGIPFFHKPPLTYWFEAVFIAIFGANEWALRLVSTLHAALMLSALYLSSRLLTHEVLAHRALLMLGTSLAFLAGGQYVNHDMVVAAWITVAIWCFALALMHGERPHANLARLGFVACALGILAKGVIGLALPGMVLLIWLIWTKQLKKIVLLPWISGGVLFSVIVLPWFVLVNQRFPTMLAYLFGPQQLSRYTSVAFNNVMPWWFYGAAVLVLLFPWALFAMYQAKVQLSPAIRVEPQSLQTVTREQCQIPPLPRIKPWLSLCWIWLLSILVFFSIPNTKVIGYVLPVMPPLAILSALGYEALLSHRQTAKKIFAGICALNIGLALALTFGMARYVKSGSRDIAQTLACAASPLDTVYAMGGYPYDLPFYTQAGKPMVVVQDWSLVSNATSDNWKNELLDGADFDARAAKVLQSTEVLNEAKSTARNWLVTPISLGDVAVMQGWMPVQRGQSWMLLKSKAEPPTLDQALGLKGCRHPTAK